MSLKNSLLKVKPAPLSGVMTIPGSKSYANRMLVLAALNPKPVTVQNVPESTDVLRMIEALKEIGLDVQHVRDQVKVLNSFPECEKQGEKPVVVHSGDGGTTTRFLSALVAKGRRRYHIEPSGGMRDRPVEEMIEVLEKLGVDVESKKAAWLSLQGPLRPNLDFELDCSRSTQFASALALVLKEKTSLMKVRNMMNSKAYFEMTLELLKDSKSTLFKVPLDFSSASYPLALAAVTGEVLLRDCHSKDPYQADSSFLDILVNSGAFVDFRKDGLHVKKAKSLISFDVSCSAYPDLAPTLAYLASFCHGVSSMRDLEVLAHKESHRLREIQKLLDFFHVDYESDDMSYLKIKGRPLEEYSHKSVTLDELDLPEDHRIVMSAYLFMRTLGGGELAQTQHVKKSFANFFELLEGRC